MTSVEKLLLLLFIIFFVADAGDPLGILERQEAQLRRLEALIDTLSAALSRLDPPSSPAVAVPAEPAGGAAGRSVAVTKHKPAWSERFQFAAAARLESPPTAAIPLPYEDLDGLTKYFAVGDSSGRSFVFSSAGDLLLDLPALSNCSVTSLLAYQSPSSRKNESFLLSGHADGSVAAYRLFEHQSNADDWLSLSLAASRLLLRCGAAHCDPVVAIEAHSAGRIRLVVAADAAGRVRAVTENGTLYGSVSSTARPLAFLRIFHQQRLLLLTETGAASLDLRTLSLRETDCDGLNGSLVASYTFDTLERSKAYGVTASGDLIHVLLLGDATVNLKCRVRAIRRAEFDGGKVALRSIKGYLLAVTNEKVMVYNVSSQFYGRVGAPRPLFFATMQEIRSFFLTSEAASGLQESLQGSSSKPLITADKEKVVVVGLGGGYIGIYRANFPVYKAESNAVVWSAPALLFLLFLIGIWQFYVKKKDALGWTSEEAFNTSTNSPPGSLLGPAPSERTFTDSSRPTDLRDLRSSGIRGPTRRYISPTRYSGASGIPFRSTSSDSTFRGAADLKYRGRDASPFPQRREPLFSNTQPVDDHTD